MDIFERRGTRLLVPRCDCNAFWICACFVRCNVAWSVAYRAFLAGRACSIARFGAKTEILFTSISCSVAETKSVALIVRKSRWLAAALFAFRPDGKMGLVLSDHSR